MPSAIRTAVRHSCSTLGSTLSEMMLKAKRDADEAKKQREASRRTNDRGRAISPPASPVKTPGASHVETVLPASGSQKRAQGEAHSPVLPQSASKRQKSGISSAESSDGATIPIASSTTSTTTTEAVLQSPPSYQPTSQLAFEQISAPASSFAVGVKSDKAEQAQSDVSGLNQRY